MSSSYSPLCIRSNVYNTLQNVVKSFKKLKSRCLCISVFMCLCVCVFCLPAPPPSKLVTVCLPAPGIYYTKTSKVGVYTHSDSWSVGESLTARVRCCVTLRGVSCQYVDLYIYIHADKSRQWSGSSLYTV